MARARALAVVGMLAAATLLAVWILPSTVALSGGPDAYGYTFDDAVPYSWIPAAGIVVADNADNCQNPGGTPDFGFGTFTYYGVAYTDVLVCPNGFVKFTGATTTGLTASSTIPYTPIPNADIVALSASPCPRGSASPRSAASVLPAPRVASPLHVDCLSGT